MTAYITPDSTGIPTVHALLATERGAAMREALQLARSLYGARFTFHIARAL